MNGTRFIDNSHRLAEIEMYDFAHGGTEWSADFFNVGGLKYSPEYAAYEVKDIDYLAEMADDWMWLLGDYHDDEGRPEERFCCVTFLPYVITEDGYFVKDFMSEAKATNYARKNDCLVIHENGNMIDY